MAPMTEHLAYGVGADTKKSLLRRHDQFKVATSLVPVSLNCSGPRSFQLNSQPTAVKPASQVSPSWSRLGQLKRSHR